MSILATERLVNAIQKPILHKQKRYFIDLLKLQYHEISI